MPKYILIEFDDEATANELIKRIHRATRAGKLYRIRGVFKTPSEFCRCGPIPSTRWHAELVRGKKYGWRLHRACGLPRKESFVPRNLWPDMLSAAARRKSLSESVQAAPSALGVAMKGGEVDLRDNYPVTIRQT